VILNVVDSDSSRTALVPGGQPRRLYCLYGCNQGDSMVSEAAHHIMGLSVRATVIGQPSDYATVLRLVVCAIMSSATMSNTIMSSATMSNETMSNAIMSIAICQCLPSDSRLCGRPMQALQ